MKGTTEEPNLFPANTWATLSSFPAAGMEGEKLSWVVTLALDIH